ncbi:MAG: hypothetical protein BWY80_00610 [Firmicutes bacterium ADurb.Bin456]|nr:MAG: hypothetical protein BWY80_00610 [Firmicutes bacterium ADurb.Bin456]
MGQRGVFILGAKKKEKNKGKRVTGKKAAAAKNKGTADPGLSPEPAGLKHMSVEWREFYRLVRERLKKESGNTGTGQQRD